MIVKSWLTLFKHPYLFFPDLINVFLTLLGGYVLFDYLGLSSSLTETLLRLESLVALQSSLFSLVLGLFIYFFFLFVLGSGLDALKFFWISNVLLQRNVSFKYVFFKSGSYTPKVILMRILVYFLYGLLLLPLSLTYSLVQKGSLYGFLLFGSLLFIFLFYQVLIFSRYPILFLQHKSVLRSLFMSFTFFLKHPFFLLRGFILITLLNLGIGFFFKSIASSSFLFSLLLLSFFRLWIEVYKFSLLKSLLTKR